MTETEPVRNYIRARQTDELSDWDVLFAGVRPQQAPSVSLKDCSLGFPLVCQRRVAGDRSNDRVLMITDKQRVSSRGIERTGLTAEETRKAQNGYDAENPSPSGRRANYPDWIYRRVRTKPLLVVHLLAIGGAGDDLRQQRPVVAWSISFPSSRHQEKLVEYVVNTTWYKEHYQDEDNDEDAGDDD